MRAALSLCLVLAACSDTSGPGGNGDDLNLAGSWTGAMTIVTDAGTFASDATLTLTHTGSTIAGAMLFAADEDNEALGVVGTLAGSTLTIVMTASQSASDDCHLFPVTLVFTATASTLTATGASGQVCDGDGMGGHESLDTVSGATGTLSR